LQDLFNKTIGPVVELHVVYNNAGQSKGMAVIAFARPQDGEAARQMYNGKIVDGRQYSSSFVLPPSAPLSITQQDTLG
jgi:THO complex subunit 4